MGCEQRKPFVQQQGILVMPDLGKTICICYIWFGQQKYISTISDICQQWSDCQRLTYDKGWAAPRGWLMQTNQYQRHSLANNRQGDASQGRCRMVWNKYLIQQYQIFDAVFTTKYLRTVFMLNSSNAVLTKLHLSGVTWNPGITAKWKQLASGFFFIKISKGNWTS